MAHKHDANMVTGHMIMLGMVVGTLTSEHGCGQHGAATMPLNEGKGEVVRMNEDAGPRG